MAKTFERTIVSYKYQLGKVEKSADGGFTVVPSRVLDFEDKPSDRTLKKALNDGEQVLTSEKVETLYRCDLADFLKIAHIVEPGEKAAEKTDADAAEKGKGKGKGKDKPTDNGENA